jgi:hypothetical protein
MKNVRLIQALRDRRVHLSGTSSLPSSAGSPVSRRRFVQTTAGALAAGAVFGRQLLRPVVAHAAGSDPLPVTGSPNLAPFRVWAPIVVDSIDAEPSTITNFNGVVGITYVSGTVRRTNLLTGHVDVLPFMDADMRFMQGVYRGADGRPTQGTFGFV